MAVSDRWHKTHPEDSDPRCGEHRGKVATTTHGQGRRWQVRYRDDTGNQVARNFTRQADADAFDAKVQRDLDTGAYLNVKAGSITLSEYALSLWLPAQLHLRPNSISTYKRHLTAQILPRLGQRRLSSLKPSDIRAFVAALVSQPSAITRKPLSPTTIATVVAVLKMALEAAVTDQLIAANPARRVPLPLVEKRHAHPMSREMVIAIADAITPRFRLTVFQGALAGLREGEALGQRHDDVDFLRRRIRVLVQAQDGELAPLKTRASTRRLPADDILLQAITEHMRRYPAGPGGVITSNRVGKIPKRSTFGDAWRKAVAAAGAPKGTRFHDLRHFYASVLIAQNLNPKVIQERMGHSNITETMDTYGHLFPEAQELGRGAFDDLFAGLDVHGKCTEQTGT